jgi:hypothetical protein
LSASRPFCVSIGQRSEDLLVVFETDHVDGVPGTAVEIRPFRSFAGAELAADTEQRVHFDAPKRRVVCIWNPDHAVLHWAIVHTGGRTGTTGARLIDDGDQCRLALASIIPLDG